jgi:hypothetical protein
MRGSQPVHRWNHSDEMHGIQQSAGKFLLVRRHDRKLDLVALEAARQPRAAVFDQVDLDTRMALLEALEELGQQILDHLRRGTDAQDAAFASFQGTRGFADRFDFGEHTAAAQQKMFPLGGQPNAPPGAMKKRDTEFLLERVDLARGRRLAEMQPVGGARHPAGIADRNEHLELAQVHEHAHIASIKEL